MIRKQAVRSALHSPKDDHLGPSSAIRKPRTPQRLRVDARRGRRTLRAPHAPGLAAAARWSTTCVSLSPMIDKPELPRREEARRQPGAMASRAEGRAHRRARLQRSPADPGEARSGHAEHPDMVLLQGGSPKGAERIAARSADHRKRARRSHSSPIGGGAQRSPRSSATTPCWRPCPSAPWSSRRGHPGKPDRQG